MLEKLYRKRFLEKELKIKYEIWSCIVNYFFNKYISPTDTVIDLAAGYCEFINNVCCANKIALDLNQDIKKFAGDDVTIIIRNAADTTLPDNSVDVCFISNFFEHIQSRDKILDILKECYRILKINGKIIILQPNIKYVKGAYWDFFDHVIPLTEKSLIEALLLANFSILKVIPKFLPYTTKSKMPKSSILIKTYLHLPIIWRLFGKQSLLVGKKL